MAKQRHNIDTIAEILIDKIEDLSKDATRLEKSVEKIQNTTIRIEPKDIDNLINVINQKIEIEKDILSQFKTLSEKKTRSVPNWIIFTLVFGFALSAAVLWGAFLIRSK